MYSFRYEDVYLGNITVQFDDRSSDDIFCICSRVIIRERKMKNKWSHTRNELLEYKSTFQRDYIYDQTPNWNNTTLNELQGAVGSQSNQSSTIEKDDAGNSDENNEVANSCGLCCFSRIFRILHKKFRRLRSDETIREQLVNPAEENCSEISKAKSIFIENELSIPVENCMNARVKSYSSCDDKIGTIVEDDDLIELGLSRMGYAFDVNESEIRSPFERITLRYSEAQINRLNKGLILPKNFPAESRNISEDEVVDMECLNHTKKHNLSPDSEPRKRRRQQSPSRCKNANWPPVIQENPNLSKYWGNRYRLFSKYDEGIQLDAESWYSVTPEKISKHISDRCCSNSIIDAFCGAGGNTIQFAQTCERVIAIDIDPKKIQMAKHNAKIYGVADRIEFIVGDFFILAPSLVADVVFLSPPWGGPNYRKRKTFPLQNIMEPYGGKLLYETAKTISPVIAYYLPRNVNVHEVYNLVEPGGRVEIQQNHLGKKLVAVTAYFNELVNDDEVSEHE